MKDNSSIPVVQCTQCSAIGFRPLYVCRKCGNTEFRDAEAPGRGHIYTHTTIRVAPDARREEAPYDVCVIEFTPDLRITARIKGAEAGTVRIGDQVIYDSADENGYWFRRSDM